MPVLARKAIAKIATELGTPVIDDCCLSDVVLDGEVPPPLRAELLKAFKARLDAGQKHGEFRADTDIKALTELPSCFAR
jgi:hypothetical protein